MGLTYYARFAIMSNMDDQTKQLLRTRLEDLRSEVNETKEEIASQQANLTILFAKIQELEWLDSQGRANGAQVDGDGEESGEVMPAETNGHVNGDSLVGATRAIIDHLAHTPGAVRPVTIVDAVIGAIATDSPSPRRLLFNTINNLVNSGRLEKTPTGRVKLKQN